MKKVNFVLIISALFITSAGFAQVSSTLEVQLHDIQSITIASGQETIHLDVQTTNDYANGVSQNKEGHLMVTSTGSYDITAKASQDLTGPSSNTIPVNKVTLTAAQATSEPGDGTTASGALSTATDLLLVDNGSADLDARYDVDYILAGGAHLLNLPTGVYTTTITYTLVPQ